MIRRLVVVLAALPIAVVALPSPSGAAAAGGADNIVIVKNSGGTVSRSGLAVSYDAAPTVANSNIAAASSSDCTGCRTVAVAMQVVMVEGSPTDFEPANAATATNAACDQCTTYAYAFQYVLQPGQTVSLTSATQQEIVALRSEVAETAATPGLTYDELKVQLEGLFDQLVTAVDAGMVSAGAPDIGTRFEQTSAG